jgi:hypothetical protein
MMNPMSQPDQVQQFSCTFVDLTAGPVPQMQWERDILEAVQSRQQIEELKDEPDFVPPDTRQFVIGE